VQGRYGEVMQIHPRGKGENMQRIVGSLTMFALLSVALFGEGPPVRPVVKGSEHGVERTVKTGSVPTGAPTPSAGTAAAAPASQPRFHRKRKIWWWVAAGAVGTVGLLLSARKGQPLHTVGTPY